MLTFIAALVARQVVVPVRDARRAAENLASGNLHDRMRVRGQDDLARLATSMNDMAAEMEKQITTLSELSQVQQRFVSDVSHELRTPLTTVRMAAEVLHDARDDFDPVSARSAELLQNELDRFESLLNDLLEISRFDAGAVELTRHAPSTCAASSTGSLDAQEALIRAYGVHVTRAHHRGHDRRGRPAPDRADPAQPDDQRDRAQRGPSGRRAARRRRRRGGRRGPRPRRRLRGEPGQAGVPAVLAGRPRPRAHRRRHRARAGHLDGGRQPARRLAHRVGPAGPRRPVPADRAPPGRRRCSRPRRCRWRRGTCRCSRVPDPGRGDVRDCVDGGLSDDTVTVLAAGGRTPGRSRS